MQRGCANGYSFVAGLSRNSVLCINLCVFWFGSSKDQEKELPIRELLAVGCFGRVRHQPDMLSSHACKPASRVKETSTIRFASSYQLLFTHQMPQSDTDRDHWRHLTSGWKWLFSNGWCGKTAASTVTLDTSKAVAGCVSRLLALTFPSLAGLMKPGHAATYAASHAIFGFWDAL